MIENFRPCAPGFAVRRGEATWTVIGWTDAPRHGIAPVVVRQGQPCIPEVLVGPASYLAPTLEVYLGEGDVDVRILDTIDTRILNTVDVNTG